MTQDARGSLRDREELAARVTVLFGRARRSSLLSGKALPSSMTVFSIRRSGLSAASFPTRRDRPSTDQARPVRRRSVSQTAGDCAPRRVWCPSRWRHVRRRGQRGVRSATRTREPRTPRSLRQRKYRLIRAAEPKVPNHGPCPGDSQFRLRPGRRSLAWARRGSHGYRHGRGAMVQLPVGE